MEELIPIILFLVSGLVLVTWIYFRSRERQLIIEKGMSYEQMQEFFKSHRDKYLFFKIGVVLFFFGVGIGTGLLLEAMYETEAWVPFFIFTMTGIGFVVAFLWARKIQENYKGQE